MESTPELVDDLRRDKVEQARTMTPQQKLAAGAELFDYACEITKMGIRARNPGIGDEAVLDELRRRLALTGERA
jgi:hypothetical protein